ncbi:AraC family transcriptional regulator [Stakelama saccharophila]|uniref:Helix-turn-helix domain-containing protein n=1 Tax=Stakelama saccharophila TaxID=3075605 RepID=A0ABZ0BBN1_9SPHN|nr:helix-turn-helix domain-containing protein [Stakelama sp. W311]WNO54481.1 helix-turn-helix domain-containing protein [Stakelama sp. W311]
MPVFEDTERADHAQLRLRLSPGGAEYRFPDGTVQVAPDLHVIGPTTGAMKVKAQGPVVCFGMGVTPVGWGALIGNNAWTMTNRVVDAVEIMGPAVAEAAEKLKGLESPDAMREIAEAMIGKLLRSTGPDLAFIHTVDAWLADTPSPTVSALARATGVSARQLERKCKSLYGAPPKVLARKYRALRTAVALVSDGVSSADAIDRGFYDQSHLIREVKHFTGLTPGQMHANPNLLAQLTIAQRHALGGRVKKIISHT